MKRLPLFLFLVAATAAAQSVTTFSVSNSDDSGPGSLRDAIVRANAFCVGSKNCQIVFDATVSARAIELESPLPVITACAPLTIGLGGALVELRGDRLKSGNGLEFRTSCPGSSGDLVVRRLAINGFPESAIAMLHGTVDHEVRVAECYLGTDVTGTLALPNRRGVVIDDERGFAVIENSVISGNERSGIFVWAARQVYVQNNMIGAGPDGELALGNGASGIYLGRTAANVEGNTIAFNRDFGVAVSRTVERASVVRNSIFENGWLGIDWELNGKIDPEISADSPVPPAPVMTEAFIDPVTKAVVARGTMRWPTKPGGGYYRILLYATPGWRTHAEGERFVAESYIQLRPD